VPGSGRDRRETEPQAVLARPLRSEDRKPRSRGGSKPSSERDDERQKAKWRDVEYDTQGTRPRSSLVAARLLPNVFYGIPLVSLLAA
jgi:hypothetical protein